MKEKNTLTHSKMHTHTYINICICVCVCDKNHRNYPICMI